MPEPDRIYIDATIALRDVVASHLTVYRESIFGPHMRRLYSASAESNVGAGSRPRGEDDASLCNLKSVISMDALYLERLAMDGPQEASFCPHPLYLFQWEPIRGDWELGIAREYMMTYSCLIATPVLIVIRQLEEQLLSLVAQQLQSSPSDTVIANWSNNVRAVNRCSRFFLRRSRPDVDPLTFFQDI